MVKNKKEVDDSQSEESFDSVIDSQEVSEETVVMQKSDLKKFFDDFSAMKDRLERVEFAASKAQLSKFDDKNREDHGKVVNLRSYDGKIIVGWDMIQNLVEKNPLTGVWEEHQTIKLIFSDDTDKIVDYRTFVRRYDMVPALVESETRHSNGVLVMDVTRKDNGEKYKIDVRFVN